MKLAVLILLFAFGVMWYRGDIGFGHRPEEFGLPSTIPKALTTNSLPTARELEKSKNNGPQQDRIEQLTAEKVDQLSNKDREAYNKQASKPHQERTLGEKVVNFLSYGKYE